MHIIIIGISVVLLLLYHGQIDHILNGWINTPDYAHHKKDSPPISIIVACRNEAINLPFLLDALCNQKNQDTYEIVIIDDASTDATLAIAKEYQLRFPHLLNILHSKNNIGKKQALAKGISVASYEHLLFTDADCVPPPKWCYTMGSHFTSTGSILTCGPVLFHKKNDVLSQFQFLDGLNSMALIAVGLENGQYANANGANMMYTKSFYSEVNGFSDNETYASGDDVFMAIQAMKKAPSSLHFCKSPKAMVITEPESTIPDFLQQRKRWATKTRAYSSHGLQHIQIKVALLSLWIIGLVIAGAWDSIYIFLAASIWSLKLLIDTRYLSKIAVFTQETLSWSGIFTTSILYPFYICYMSMMALFPTSYVWKGIRRM